MTIRNIVIFILLGVISWLIIVNIGEDELHETTVKDLKTRNEVLLSKQKESALELTAARLKVKESEERITTHQETIQTKQIIHHEKIDSVRTFTKSEAYRFLTDRYFGVHP